MARNGKDVFVAATTHVHHDDMVIGQSGREFHNVSQRVRRFQSMDDAFSSARELECFERFFVGDRHIFCATDVMQPRVFWPDARIVQASGDRETFEDLTIFVLEQLGAVAMQDARTTACQRRAVLHLFVHAFSTSFDADNIDRWIIEERIEQTHFV